MTRPRKKTRHKRDSNPGSSALEADALPLGQRGSPPTARKRLQFRLTRDCWCITRDLRRTSLSRHWCLCSLVFALSHISTTGKLEGYEESTSRRQVLQKDAFHLGLFTCLELLLTSLLTSNRLVGLVVRRPPRERKIPGSNPACAGIFPGSSHTSDLKIGTPVATLPGAWRYRVSTGTGGPGVRILWLGEMESLVCPSISVWQHVKLSVQIRPWDTLACCWDAKQPTNKQSWHPGVNGEILNSNHIPARVEQNIAKFSFCQFGYKIAFRIVDRGRKAKSNLIQNVFKRSTVSHAKLSPNTHIACGIVWYRT